MNYEEGTCIWQGPTYGYIGRGMFTNCSYEGQIYFHYKNIVRKGLRNPKYRELKPGDVVEFIEGEGFYNDGTQAMKVRVKYLVEDNDKRQGLPGAKDEAKGLVGGGMENLDGQDSKEAVSQLQERDVPGQGDATCKGSDDEQPDKEVNGQEDSEDGKPKPE